MKQHTAFLSRRARAGLLLLLALLLAALSACGSHGVYAEDAGSTWFHGVCEDYSGEMSRELTVSENARISVRCSFSRKDGQMDVRITAADGSEAYRGDGVTGGSFSVELNHPGTYTIAVQTRGFSGSFSFDWETVGAAPAP